MASFEQLVRDYTQAFNDRDLERTVAFLDPSVQVTFKAEKRDFDIPMFRAAFQTQWADPKFKAVEIEALEEIENGARCTMLDSGRGCLATVEYIFAQDDAGEWKMVRQDMTSAEQVPTSDE